MKKHTLFENYYDTAITTHNTNLTLKIPVGVNQLGVLEQVEISEKYWQHILITGLAGSGKSNYLRTVLASLLLNYSAEEVNIWLSDGGMCEFNRFLNAAPAHIKRVNTSCKNEDCVAFVEALDAEVKRRISYLAAAEKTSFYSHYQETSEQPFPRMVIMIDGFDHFVCCLSDVDRYYIEKLENIVKYASNCGITFIASAQEALFLAQRISRSFFELFGIRIATKHSADSYDVLFNPRETGGTREFQSGKVRMLYITSEIENRFA